MTIITLQVLENYGIFFVFNQTVLLNIVKFFKTLKKVFFSKLVWLNTQKKIQKYSKIFPKKIGTIIFFTLKYSSNNVLFHRYFDKMYHYLCGFIQHVGHRSYVKLSYLINDQNIELNKNS